MTKKVAQNANKAAEKAANIKPEHYLVTGPEGVNSAYLLAGSAEEATDIWAQRYDRDASEAKAEVIRPGNNKPPATAPAVE